MKRAHFITLLCLFCSAYAQPQIKDDADGINSISFSGTLVMAAVASDGIVIAADSRLSIQMNSVVYGYLDNTEKLFIAERFAVSFIGVGFFFANSAKKEVNEFCKKNKKYSSPFLFLKDFVHFLKYRYGPDTDLGIIVCCGYDSNNGAPAICYYNKNYFGMMKQTTPFTSDATEQIFTKKYSITQSSFKLKEHAILAIDSFPILNPDTKYIIGGKVSVLRINKNSTFDWLIYTKDFVNFDTYYDVLRHYFSVNSTVKLIKPEFKEIVDEELRKALNSEPNRVR